MEVIQSDVCRQVMEHMESYDSSRYTARDVRAALEPVGVKLNVTTTRVDDETLIRMVGRGLGVSMMTELMIRGRTDDVRCVPVEPMVIRELGMGTHIRKKETESIRKLKDCMLQFLADKRLL